MSDFRRAAIDYDRAIELEPDNEKLYYLRGTFRRKCQENDLALADFDRVLAIDSSDDNARACRGSTLMQLRRFQEAIEDFAHLIAMHPEHPQAYTLRAYAFAAIGNADRAKQDTDKLMQLAPELTDDLLRSTEAATVGELVRREDYYKALDSSNEIILNWPGESIGYRLRGIVRWAREEYVEAYEDYTWVIDQDGRTAECLSARGQILAELGDWEQAFTDLDQAIEFARNTGKTLVLAHALNGRSLTYAGMGSEAESCRDFEESVSLCPTNPWVYYHRGIRMFHENCFNESRILLELALELSEPPLSKRKRERAISVLRKIADANPRSSS